MEPIESGNDGLENDGAGNENGAGESANAGSGNADGNAGDNNAAPVKRGRGRPRKLDAPRDPAAGLDAGTAGTGRNSGKSSTVRPRKETGKALQNGLEILAGKIYGLHLIGAMATGFPELAITEAEARELADAIQIVAKEYDVKITGKTAASINLLFTAGVIYGQKAYAIYQRTHSQPKPQAVREPEPAPPMAVQPIKWN